MLVSAPASTANCGPGFDTLAIAVNLRFYLSNEPFEDAIKIEEQDNRLEFSSYKDNGGKNTCLYYKSEIPTGKGLGSSAAAIAAGAFLALLETQENSTTCVDQVYKYTGTTENHFDNAGATCYGGCIVALENTYSKFNIKGVNSLYFYISNNESPTHKGRSVVPTKLSLKDSVFNIANTALFVSACNNGELEKLNIATQDKIHQNKRLENMPESKEEYDNATKANAKAVWLSGSGPSICAIFAEEEYIPKNFQKIDISELGLVVH